MGIFDALKNQVTSEIKREISKAANSAKQDLSKAVAKGMNRVEKFTFQKLPQNVEELKALPESKLDSAFKTTALAIAALCRYETSEKDAIEMLNFLKGPEPVSEAEKQFLKDRLDGKFYKSFSFFEGATPQNGYTPSTPYVIKVSETQYSFENENWAVLYVTSGGADSPSPVKLRKKPSTNQWFLNELQCLTDIRIPTKEDKWA